MSVTREEFARPAWSDDQLDSPVPPEIKAPYFDDRLGVWILTRYADVLAAFRIPDLVPMGAKNRNSPTILDEAERLRIREETLAALSPRQLRDWKKELTPEVERLVSALPVDTSVDLVGKVILPACLLLATVATEVNPHDAERLGKIARHVSAAAAEPYDLEIHSLAKTANAELRGCFHAKAETLRDSGFVALSHTLPCLIANVWLALVQHPQQWRRLHHQPALLEKAMDELLRYAGLTRLLFRRAISDIEIDGVRIRKGDRVALRLLAANKDPHHFPHPNQMDLTRRSKGHFTFGSGPHSCVGASLLRMAAVTVTRPLLERFARAELSGTVKWQGGPVFRSPAKLPVRLFETRS